MILVDTAVWIDHLHAADRRLVELLGSDEIGCHPLVIEELALGSIKQREVASKTRCKCTGRFAASSQHTWQENSGGSHTTLQLAPDGVMGNEARVPLRIALAGPGPTVL